MKTRGLRKTRFDNKRFGMYLRQIREKRGLSLAAVERMSTGLPERVTKSHLSRIENGLSTASFAQIYTLSMIYRVSVSSLANRFKLCLKKRRRRARRHLQP